MAGRYPELRMFVRGTYDMQKLRIEIGNRLVGNFKIKLGIKPSKKEKNPEQDKEAAKILKMLRENFKKITDGVTLYPTRRNFKKEGIIDTYSEFALVASYMDLERQEEMNFRRLAQMVDPIPIYSEWLQHSDGIGPAMSGVLISEFDIYKALASIFLLEVLWPGCRRRRSRQISPCRASDRCRTYQQEGQASYPQVDHL